MITVTESAITKIQQMMQKDNLADHHLRMAVKGGGCSGFSYWLDFAKEPTAEEDVVEVGNGLKVFVDRNSWSYLNGTILDYKEELNKSGFQFENPKATGTCGCGESFSV